VRRAPAAERVHAEFTNGVLTVHLPNTQTQVARQMPFETR
jgi:HSP20 family molecular chaperone IbpA